MENTILPVFQGTVHKTEEWLSDIMNLLDWPDQRRAYKALRAVLHTLRDRLTIEEATDLSAQLPMLVRGLFFEGWKPTLKPERIRKVEDFVARVNGHFSKLELEDLFDAEDITRSVLHVLSRHVSAGEIRDVIANLPEPLRQLWD
jgi:uncharacterized protein (DUF2267 family)